MCVSMCIRHVEINWLLHILVWNDHELKISVCMYATCNNEDTQTLRRFFHVSVFSGGGFDHFILEVALGRGSRSAWLLFLLFRVVYVIWYK